MYVASNINLRRNGLFLGCLGIILREHTGGYPLGRMGANQPNVLFRSPGVSFMRWPFAACLR